MYSNEKSISAEKGGCETNSSGSVIEEAINNILEQLGKSEAMQDELIERLRFVLSDTTDDSIKQCTQPDPDIPLLKVLKGVEDRLVDMNNRFQDVFNRLGI